jgi:hypothetical protein
MRWPPNKTGALPHAPIEKLTQSHYRCVDLVQACFPQWRGEAKRLWCEYRQTGKLRHLRALARHIAGMLQRGMRL